VGYSSGGIMYARVSSYDGDVDPPPYVELHASGELRERARRALELLDGRCRVCPRLCTVDRLADRPGLCRVGRHAVVASHFPHFGEEDCLRGWRGSGTIFFSGCNLRCVYCVNLMAQRRRAACARSRLADQEATTSSTRVPFGPGVPGPGCCERTVPFRRPEDCFRVLPTPQWEALMAALARESGNPMTRGTMHVAPNFAETVTSAVKGTTHAPAPLQGADQPTNRECPAGIGRRTTFSPARNRAEHVRPQSMPVGILRTWPEPEPLFVTRST